MSPLNQPRHAPLDTRSRRGISLLECVVAVVIVSGAIASAAMSIQQGVLAQEDALRISQASSAAESALTELLVREYDSLTPGVVTKDVGEMTDPFTGNELPADYSRFGRRVLVADDSIAIPGYAGLAMEGKMLTVSVFDRVAGDERELIELRRFRPKSIEENIDG